jgi:hypothetical protein
MGLKPGDNVMVYYADEQLCITTPKLALKYAKDVVKRYVPEDKDLVAELIAERRNEAERE